MEKDWQFEISSCKLASQVVLAVKNLPANAGDIRDSSSKKDPTSDPGSRVSHGYSCSRWRMVGPLSDQALKHCAVTDSL